ncbi:MAG: hypothetical protein AB7T63_03755 [Planctomycetota bacterium]
MSPRDREDAAARFERSMAIDYEKWHDGIGYDLDAIDGATPAERQRIERLLLARRYADWRDVEALARLRTPAAEAELRIARERGSPEVRMAVLRHAPWLVSDAEREAALVRALGEATIYGGLTAAIDQAVEFHPPAVVEALWRGLLDRPGEVAVHYAALLAFLHGRAEEPFDMALRPLFLRFATEEGEERRAALAELRRHVGLGEKP